MSVVIVSVNGPLYRLGQTDSMIDESVLVMAGEMGVVLEDVVDPVEWYRAEGIDIVEEGADVVLPGLNELTCGLKILVPTE